MNAHSRATAFQLPSPPHSIEAEQALLGAILINNEAFHAAADRVDVADFFEPLHAQIFTLIAQLIRADKVATPVTLKPFLPSDLDIAGLSGPQYLARLAAEATTIINAADYAETISDMAKRRKAIALAHTLIEGASNPDPGVKASDLIVDAIDSLDVLAEEQTKAPTTIWLRDAMARAVDTVAKAYQSDGALTGISWGLTELDRLTLGLHAGELTILAGRPSMGKSAIALATAVAAAKNGHGTAFYSLEMSDESLAIRAVAEHVYRTTGVRLPYFALRSGRFNPADFDHVIDAAKALAEFPLAIEVQAAPIGQLTARVRRLKKRFARLDKKLELLIVDYLQLMTPGERYRGARVNEVTEISAGLKRLAHQENIAVLALSQLSREVEKRDDKRPKLADLRDSGAIEQDADTVIFLYREEYYLQQSKPKETDRDRFAQWLADGEKAHNNLEIIIGKQRHGPTATTNVYFDAGTNFVQDLAVPRDAEFQYA